MTERDPSELDAFRLRDAGPMRALAHPMRLRILGLLLPIALSWMAWRSSRERAMNAATGLLYLATAAVLGGELLGRGLLFVTGKAV